MATYDEVVTECAQGVRGYTDPLGRDAALQRLAAYVSWNFNVTEDEARRDIAAKLRGMEN